MKILELVMLSIGVSMDAFAVSVCKGITLKNNNHKKALIIAIYFGIFQALMPLIGYILGSTFNNIITKIDHWIAFGLLSIIGFNMLKDCFNKEEKLNDLINIKTMFPLAIATSIDALAIGITFSLLKINIITSILLIGITTATISFIGVIIGNKIGNLLNKVAKILGGLILIIIGIKILIEHLT